MQLVPTRGNLPANGISVGHLKMYLLYLLDSMYTVGSLTSFYLENAFRQLLVKMLCHLIETLHGHFQDAALEKNWIQQILEFLHFSF